MHHFLLARLVFQGNSHQTVGVRWSKCQSFYDSLVSIFVLKLLKRTDAELNFSFLSKCHPLCQTLSNKSHINSVCPLCHRADKRTARDAVKKNGHTSGQRLTFTRKRRCRMQSRAQEQPLALTIAVKPHYSTNGKEEEVNTGEEARLSSGIQIRSDWCKVKERAYEESLFWQSRRVNMSYVFVIIQNRPEVRDASHSSKLLGLFWKIVSMATHTRAVFSSYICTAAACRRRSSLINVSRSATGWSLQWLASTLQKIRGFFFLLH